MDGWMDGWMDGEGGSPERWSFNQLVMKNSRLDNL